MESSELSLKFLPSFGEAAKGERKRVGVGVEGDWDERDKHERESSGTDLPLILINTRLM